MRILFIGNYLSKKRGTRSVSEQLRDSLQGHKEFELTLVSEKENKILRMLDIIKAIFFRSYDVAQIDVFSGQAFRIAQIASILLRLRSKPIIMTLHGGMLHEFFERKEGLIRRTFKRASYIHTPSLFLQSFFNKKGLEVQYLPNAINLDIFPFKRDEIEPCSILWVRAFDKIYNPNLPIEILAEIVKKFQNAQLYMVGPDKGELANVKKLAEHLGVSKNVQFVGVVPNDTLYQYYQTKAIYLNTTSYESFGISIMEAASCGIPIISSSVGEIPLLWDDGKEAMLIRNWNVQNFTEAITSIFLNKEKGSELSKNARKKAERFSSDNILIKWEHLIRVFGNREKNGSL